MGKRLRIDDHFNYSSSKLQNAETCTHLDHPSCLRSVAFSDDDGDNASTFLTC